MGIKLGVIGINHGTLAYVERLGINKMQFEKDLESEFRELFLSARQFLLSFEGIEETKKARITTYGDKNGGICHMRTTKMGVDIGFLKGVLIPDKYGLLTGKTKKMRVYSITELREDVLGYYVAESLRLNREHHLGSRN